MATSSLIGIDNLVVFCNALTDAVVHDSKLVWITGSAGGCRKAGETVEGTSCADRDSGIIETWSTVTITAWNSS